MNAKLRSKESSTSGPTGDRYYPTPSGPPRLTVHIGCGGKVDERLRCRRCREHVDFGDLEVIPGPGLRAQSPRGRRGTLAP